MSWLPLIIVAALVIGLSLFGGKCRRHIVVTCHKSERS